MLIKVKQFIRESEATIAVESLGILPQNVHSLNLPFYEFKNSKKKIITERDYDIVRETLKKVQP